MGIKYIGKVSVRLLHVIGCEYLISPASAQSKHLNNIISETASRTAHGSSY